MKPIKIGLGYIVDKNWNNIMAKDRVTALRIGKKYMPEHLRKLGFGAALFEAEDYYRISYGHK